MEVFEVVVAQLSFGYTRTALRADSFWRNSPTYIIVCDQRASLADV
jgi:hypothetical protein